jgi:hypothetical protein
MKKLYVVAPLVLALTACGTPVSLVKPSAGVDSEGSGKRFLTNEVNYPGWYNEAQDSKDKSIYAVATEESRNFQFAVDHAMLSAKRELAANFSSHISAMMKDYASQSGDTSSMMPEIDRTTKMVVARVNLIGVQRDKLQVVHEKNGYRAFVRLKYNVDESNRLLMQEINRNAGLNNALRASRSFRELEREVNKIEKTQEKKQTDQINEINY